MPKGPIPIRLTGGMNNRNTPLELHARGDLVRLINADTTYPGEIRPLRPLTALNSTAENYSIHSVFRANDIVLVGSNTVLKYVNGTALTSLLTDLANNNFSFGHAGSWCFIGDGTNKKAVYLDTPVGTDWGLDIPSAGPTCASGAAGNPNGTYSCYYRYKITLPDGTILRTALSAIVTEITVASQKIEWSNIAHASFEGATTIQAELFRTATGLGGIYQVALLAEGVTTFSDDYSDAGLITLVEYAETGYWPPPSNPSIVIYHPGADRVFCAVDNSVYWSLAAKYHVFLYDEDAGEYTNINDVFLSGEDVTGMVMIDEQLYIASQKTWIRLRGTNPDTWDWDPTNAIKGPVSWRAAAVTRWGVIYPGNDGRMWLFNGFEASTILEHFVFDTDPDSTCHATFDRRFYRLFYGDSTYPELVIDFYGFPDIQPRIVKSTQSATSSCYDNLSDELYLGDSNGYVRNGEDTNEEVSILIETPEIAVEDLTMLGDESKMIIRCDTGGDDLTVTPKEDGVEQSALEAITSSSLEFEIVPLAFNDYYVIAFVIEITSSSAVRIMDPIMIAKDD